MTTPQPCDHPHCGKPPVWLGTADGRGRYQCDHGPAGWRTTSGPIPEPEARAEWDRWFGVPVPPLATPEAYPPDLPRIDPFHQLGPKGA